MRLSHRLLSATLPLLCLFGAVPLSADDDFEARRAAALARPRAVIINSDGCDTSLFPKDRPVTVEGFYATKLGKMKHGVVDTVSYCMFFDARTLYPGKILPLYDCAAPEAKTKNGMRELLALGTDPVKLAEAYCRRENLEFFLSFRMNDTHDAAWRPGVPPKGAAVLMSPYKLERLHLLHGAWDSPPPYSRWSAWDYARSEVRQMMRDVVAEAVAYVHPDGVEYDFMRHAQLFKSVAEGKHATQAERDLMTAFMRDLRAITEAAGRRQNRPILVAVRVPDSLEYCQKLGIDLEVWMREKLVDIVIGGAYFQLQPWRESAALAHKYKVKFYPSLGGESRIARKKGSLFLKGRNSPEYHAATALAAWEQGVDGLYFFNSDYAKPEVFVRNVDLRPDKARYADKDYFATERGSGGASPDTYLAGGKAFSKMPEIDPGSPAMLTPEVPFRFTIFVGDDLAQAAAAGHPAKVQAELRSQDADKAKFSLAVNGRDCGPAARKNDILTFTVPADALKKGDNEFTIQTQAEASLPVSRKIMRGNQLLVGKARHPWRRIFQTGDLAKAETIVRDAGGDALRIADDEAAPGHAAGFLCLLHTGEKTPLQVYFTMKLESSDTPGAVAVRLATGKYVEIAEFMPDSIRFRHAGKSVKFDTRNAFHNYRFRFDPNRKLFILNEEKHALLSAAPVVAVDSPEARIAEAGQQVSGMQENSFYFGSLSGAGKGAALWRNIRLVFPFVHLNDFVLKIRYEH